MTVKKNIFISLSVVVFILMTQLIVSLWSDPLVV